MTRPGRTTAAPRVARWRILPGPSLELRVGRLMFLIVAVAVLLTASGSYLATHVSSVRAVDATLASAAANATGALGPDPDRAALQAYVARSTELGVVVGAVVGADGWEFHGPGSEAIPLDARDLAVASHSQPAHSETVTGVRGTVFRVLVVPVGQQPGYALLVARPMAAIQQILRTLALSSVAIGLLAVVAAGLVARRVARAGVAPVRQLTSEVEERAAADDLAPVQVVREDEIGRLAIAFNHLLDTVKVSRVRQARFVADAGHELRTPLTSIRTNIELLAADADHSMLRPADRLTIMRDVRAQLIQFSDLVSDLIGLTREDRTAADFEEVDLTAVLEEAVDRISMRTVGVRWVVDLDPTYLNGDADLLTRAFANVLDNAVKYSPAGGAVSVTLRDGEVRISDQGGGVDPAERAFVFDRFFRSEASRATPGTGLGLSITESVVRQHGGTVVVTDAPGGGAMFVLTFPFTTSRSLHDRLAPGSAADRQGDGEPPVSLGGSEA